MAVFVGTASNNVLSIVDRATDSLGSFSGGMTPEITDYLADTIYGLGGNDDIRAGVTNSSVYGGEGNDILKPGYEEFGSVRCNLFGDAGNDTLYDYSEDARLFGGLGNDTLNVFGQGIAEGGAGADHINGGGEYGGTVSYRNSTSGVVINLFANTAQGGDATGDTIKNLSRAIGSSFGDSLTGGAFNDELQGLAGNDTLLGAWGNDYMSGDAGNDVMFGGLGNDTFAVGLGQDTVFGGDGSDSIYFENAVTGVKLNLVNTLGGGGTKGLIFYSIENVSATGLADVLIGSASANKFNSGSGNDSLYGAAGNDELDAGAGSDTLFGGVGDDILKPGEGRDSIYGGDGFDTLSFLHSFSGGVTIDLNKTVGIGGDANLNVYFSIENVVGTDAGDKLVGSAGSNTLAGNSGNDQIDGGAGNDNLYGGAGNDFLFGAAGNDTISGSAGVDSIYGGDGIDVLSLDFGPFDVYLSLDDLTLNFGYEVGEIISSIEGLAGGTGNDTLIGDIGNNVLFGGAGNDFLNGYLGNDTQYGENGDDVLYSEGGNDLLFGGNGSDLIQGGDGNDVIVGNAGRDALLGEAGRDVFSFRSVLDTGTDQATADVIVDFNAAATDRIDLSMLDAKLTTVLNEAFTFVAAGGFTGSGQVLVLQSGGNSYVAINNDGDLSVDLMIRLNGLITLDATDFIL